MMRNETFREPNQKTKSVQMCLAFSMTALILFFPANIFPFMSIEMYGQRSTSTIWEGVVILSKGKSWILGVIVFLASIVIPLIKLLILFYLSLTADSHRNVKAKMRLYYFIEAIGRWSMLDIYLMAVFIAILKLGSLANAQPELGSYFFTGVVVFTMMASAMFNPLLLGKENFKNGRD